MYLYSLVDHRIKYKIDMEDEQFLSMKIDQLGFFFETQSFKTPRKTYRIDFDQRVFRRVCIESMGCISVTPMLWNVSKIPNINVDKFQIQHDSFYSFDKTKVPMTIIQKAPHNSARKKPCLVFAYGGYGIPMLPIFKLFFLLFIELFNGIVG